MGSDAYNGEMYDSVEVISIHAPAWGATINRRYTMATIQISIHAPAWGATRKIRESFCGTIYFNPRSRMGSDVPKKELTYLDDISIHAPAWGATITPHFPSLDLIISIHAPAWGATKVKNGLN